MPQLKILISGGGVAGCSLAFWLAKLNHNVTVVEHFPTLRTTGLQIDLRGYGIEILKRMGLEKGFRERAAPEEGMQLVDSRGRNRAYFGANRTGEGAQGITSDYEIMRGDLTRLIHDATGSSARYIYGTSIASLQESDNGVDVTFRDGKTEHFDLVVGCDGAFSSTRKMMLGTDDATVGFKAIGEYNAYLTFKRPMEKGERYVGMLYPAPGKISLLTRRHNPEEMQLYLLCPKRNELIESVKRGDVEEEKKAFADLFRGAGWKTEELLQEMMDSTDFYCERIGVVKLDSWHKGHVTLLGDAASAPGGSGMGTTCAMVGAYVLAGEIGRHCGRGDDDVNSENNANDGLLAALQAYDDKFRPFMDQIQKGLESGAPEWLMPNSPWGIEVFHNIATVVALLMAWFTPVIKYFTKEDVKNWSLPDYEEMSPIRSEKEDKQ